MNIKDIAAIAGVSIATVSKVLNKKDKDISSETRKKVLDIVKKYNYAPYTNVINSKTIKSYIIAVVTGERNRDNDNIIYNIENYVSEADYSLMLATVKKEEEEQKRSVDILCSKNVEAVIILIDNLDTAYIEKRLVEKNIPIITFGTKDRDNLKVPGLICNLENVGYKLTKYLLDKGHSRIACVLGENDQAIKKGYIKALYEEKIVYDPMKTYQEEVLYGDLKNWLSMDCTAILCNDTKTAVRLYKYLADKGMSIPEDISIICARDSDYAEIIDPPLTSLKFLWDEIAGFLVRKTVNIIENIKNSSPLKIDSFFSIIERGSTANPPSYKRRQRIVAVGSMNMDVNISLPKIPVEGENMTASSVSLIPGGKGANQAVGAAKLESNVYALGCLGNDAAAKEIYNNLIANNVRTDGIVFDNSMDTGKAYINVAENGSSTIVIYRGANNKLSRAQIYNNAHLFDGAKYCLLSTEIPEDTVAFTITLCEKKQAKVILKPAGIDSFSEDLIKKVEFFIPSLKELNLLLPGLETVEQKAQKLFDSGAKNVIITLGADGCYLKNKEYSRFFPAANVLAVDTTGGADAFISALAVYLSEGVDVIKAIGFAIYSAGICVAGYGVQPVLPQRSALDMYKDEIDLKFKADKQGS
jgi:ribokinase